MQDQSIKQADIFIGKAESRVAMTLKYANRHGLIAGATGTGKTVSLQILAEGFSDAGVPVFMADVKGDLSGIAATSPFKGFLTDRAQTVGLEDYHPTAYPTTFWDLYGKQGHPIRTTIMEMGPLLLAQLLNCNDTQEGVLVLAFRLAEDEDLLLLNLKDLRALLVNIAQRSSELSAEYGNVSKASVGAIQRRLLALEDQGGDLFFGEPALDLKDMIRTAKDGRGMLNVLAADKLMMAPKLYATFLLWLLSELFEELPEIGDPEKPVFVFFFDEAHLLFDDAPDALMDKIEQVVRLIRSKGVGVYFVTQNPQDVPDEVSSQLGNRVQHALRAFTPKEQRVIKAAAETFRPNPKFKSIDVITELGIGEALVSTLLKKGVPSMVERTLIRPPSSRLGPITKKERAAILSKSDLGEKYDQMIDRASAYEILKERQEKIAKQQQEEKERITKEEERDKRDLAKARKKRKGRSTGRRRSRRMSTTEKMAGQATRTATRTIVNALVRGIFGGLKR